MTIELEKLIKNNQESLYRFINKRDELRNKIHFCGIHKFDEERRIDQIKLDAMSDVIYEYQQFIIDLNIIIKSFETND